VVILVADGARPDTLAGAMDRGELPALARLRADGGSHVVTSVFPSVTGPAYTPFLMGRYPGPVGVPGIRWYDRERTRARWPAYSRSYVGYDIKSVNGDIDPASQTLWDLSGSRLSNLSVIERGLKNREKVARGAGFVVRVAFTHFRGNVAGWLDIDRHLGEQIAERIGREKPEIAFCALTGIDKTSHSTGHDSAAVMQAMKNVDRTVERIRSDAERDGRWEQMHLWIVSDHGHSAVQQHEDLAGIIEAWGVGVRAHPFTVGRNQQVAVMVSGNAMAHLSLDIGETTRPWWPRLASRWEWLADRLLERESTDLLILPHSPTAIELRSRSRGRAVVRQENGRYSYRPESGDPLGIGELTNLTDEAAYDATINSDYPDALVQLVHLCASSRCGDLLISAARNWDLRSRYEPIPHVSSHGALHREHMLVPLITNRPARIRPRRTVDVFATAAQVLQSAVASSIDGRSWL
jgi:hypothetical protein